jgi:hypothetical protein
MLIPDPVSAQLSSAAAVTPREVADEHLRLLLLLIFLVSARGLLAWVVLANSVVRVPFGSLGLYRTPLRDRAAGPGIGARPQPVIESICAGGGRSSDRHGRTMWKFGSPGCRTPNSVDSVLSSPSAFSPAARAASMSPPASAMSAAAGTVSVRPTGLSLFLT